MTFIAAIRLGKTIIDVNHVNLFQHSGALPPQLLSSNVQTCSQRVLNAHLFCVSKPLQLFKKAFSFLTLNLLNVSQKKLFLLMKEVLTKFVKKYHTKKSVLERNEMEFFPQ